MKRPPLICSAIGAALFLVAAFALCAAIHVETSGEASGRVDVVDNAGAVAAFPTPPPIGFTVNSTLDSGDSVINGVCETSPGNGVCTLRAAIQEANAHPGAAINFNIPTTDPGYINGTWTIKLFSGLPNLTAAITMGGPGTDKLTVRRSTTGNYSIFNITTSGTVTLSGMTVTNANIGGINNQNGGTVNISNCTLSGNSSNAGGGIYNTGSLTVTNSTLSGNGASSGGGIFNNGTSVSIINSTLSGNSVGSGIGGGIFNNNSSGTVNVTNSILEGNTSQSEGGGIYNAGTVNITNSTLVDNSVNHGIGGGGIYNHGTVNITDSTFRQNKATPNTGSSQGGALYNMGMANITNSTFDGNSTLGSGGAVFNQTHINVTNSTLVGNTASNGNGGGIDNEGSANVSNSTLTGNTASSNGGGLFNNVGALLVIKSALIASNTLPSSSPDVSGMFASQGFNLIGKRDGSTGFGQSTDQTGIIAAPLDPKLGALQDNGGPTDTVALLTGSPAIDKGTSNGLTGTLTVDQRGVGYARTINKSIPNASGGDGTDIGAFELGAQIKAVSRKTHGTVGNFDIKLPLTGTKPGVECRKSGSSHVFKVIVTFPKAVTVGSASVTPDAKAPGATASLSSLSVSGSQVTLNLTGVSNAQTILITLFNVSDATNTNDVSVPMGVLLGDTNNNASVTDTDVSLTQSKVGQALSGSNFREDVTLDGVIDSQDVTLVTSRKGTALP